MIGVVLLLPVALAADALALAGQTLGWIVRRLS